MINRFKRYKLFRLGGLKLAAVVVVLLALPLTVYVVNQQQEVRSRAASCVGDCGGGGGGPSLISCPGTDETLKSYSITVTGTSSCLSKDRVVSAVSKPYAYQGFRQKVEGVPLEFRGFNSKSEDWGYTVNEKLVKLNKIETRGSNDQWNFIITHELFHVLATRNHYYQDNYPYQALANLDKNCFRNTAHGPVIKTYALRTPAIAKHESFAESGALYLLDKSPFSSQGNISSFKTQCPNSYNWFRNNIF